MKLANALSQRSELQTRIRQLEARLYNNAEDPEELLRELEEDYARLEELISAINRTNGAARTEDGSTLSDLLARRDCLKGKLGILRNFLDNASALVRRRTAGEIRIKSAVDLRQLEETIQEKNWTTELL